MKRSVVTVLGTAFGLGCLGYFLYKANLSEVGSALTGARWDLLLVTMVLGQLMNVVRAARWTILLGPMAQISWWRSFVFTSIQFGSNVLLPARAGEFIKPLLARRETKAPYSGIFATVVLERLFDLVFMICMLAVILTHLGPLTGEDGTWVARLRYFGGLMTVMALGLLVTLVGLAMRPALTRRVVAWFLRPLPRAIGDRLLALVDTFVQGLAVVREPKALAAPCCWTLLLWCVNVCLFRVCGLAFGFDVGFFGAALVQVAIAFAVALPQAPGFIGVFQVAAEASLRIVGVSTSPAKAYAIAVWAVGTIPTALLTVFLVSREGATLGGLSAAGQELAVEEGAVE